MDNFYLMLKIQSQLIIFLIVGIYANKANILNKNGRLVMTDYLLKIALPCMVFESFNSSINKEQLFSAVVVLCIAFLISSISLIIGKLFWKTGDKNLDSVLKYGTLISNGGFAGLPIVENTFGELGLFYASIFIIPTRIFMWTFGISLFTNTSTKSKIKSILLNPGIISVMLGILRIILNINLPVFFNTAIKNIGSSTTSISMIIVGSIIGSVSLKTIINLNVIKLTIIRCILIPLITLFIMKLLKVDMYAISAGVILTGMPVGSTTTILAQKYDSDYIFASKVVVFSTIFSLISIPLISLLL